MPKPKPKTKPTNVQLPAEREKKRSEAARKAALARWEKEEDRPLSKRAQREAISKIPTSELTVEHYAGRPNPERSWAAAILKRERSGVAQRRAAAAIISGGNRSPWSDLPPEKRSEIARRGGVRRWQIWREEQARLHGQTSGETKDKSAK